jgi:hypothetical protein
MLDLERRVENLERQNKRLRRSLTAVVVVLALLPLVGAMWPQYIPEHIAAGSISVIDSETGATRWMLSASGGSFLDENDAMRFEVNRFGVSYADENETQRLRLGAHPDSESADLGASTPAAVVIYGADGSVVWRAPQ